MNKDKKQASKKKIINTHLDTSDLKALEDLPPQEIKTAIDNMADKIRQMEESMSEILKGFSLDLQKIDPSDMDPIDANVLKVFQDVVDEVCESITGDEEVDLDEIRRAAEKRPKLPPITTFGLMSDKIARKLPIVSPHIEKENGEIKFQWNVNGAPRNKKAVATFVELSIPDTGIEVSRPINAFDMAVCHAVANKFYFWNLEHPGVPLRISKQEIWRAMEGKENSSTPSALQIRMITESMDRMRTTTVRMDNSEEKIAKYKTLNADTDIPIKDNFIYAQERMSFFETEKGQRVSGYNILAEPILYTYSKAKSHVLFLDPELLNTTDEIRTTEELILFKYYMLTEIELMIENYRASNRMKFETIYRDSGVIPPKQRVNRAKYTTDKAYNTAVRKESKKDRDKIFAILNVWKQKGHIEDYSIVKDGCSYVGVDITIKRKKKQVKEKRNRAITCYDKTNIGQ